MVSKFFLFGVVLCVVTIFSDAAFDRVSSEVSSTVQENFPVREYATIFGHGKQMNYRVKRAVATKHLEDPDNCISYCRGNMTTMIVKVTVKDMGNLVAAISDDITTDDLNKENEEAFKEKIKQKTIENMGPLFQDMCTISKQTDDCYTKCPPSQLKNITTVDHSSTETFCEPGRNWANFTAYWNALNCTNTTEEKHPCDSKCGKSTSISNVTSFELDDEEDGGAELTYETDIKKNNAAVGPVCKQVSCKMDCYKPIMTQRCGAKAYDLFSRMRKLDTQITLKILKVLNAVGSVNDCKAYQQ